MDHTETRRRWFLCSLSVFAAFLAAFTFAIANFTLSFVNAQQANVALTGNWRVQTQNADGTFRRSYFNSKQDGPLITGSIRVTQFYYLISNDSGPRRGHDALEPLVIMPDHVPRISEDPSRLQAFAYTFGYLKALIAAVAAES